jgi:hypothetical protein
MLYYSEYGVYVLNVPVHLQSYHNITVLLKTVYQAGAKDFHFSKTSIPSLWPSHPLIRWVQGLFPGVKAAGA